MFSALVSSDYMANVVADELCCQLQKDFTIVSVFDFCSVLEVYRALCGEITTHYPNITRPEYPDLNLKC